MEEEYSQDKLALDYNTTSVNEYSQDKLALDYNAVSVSEYEVRINDINGGLIFEMGYYINYLQDLLKETEYNKRTFNVNMILETDRRKIKIDKTWYQRHLDGLNPYKK